MINKVKKKNLKRKAASFPNRIEIEEFMHQTLLYTSSSYFSFVFCCCCFQFHSKLVILLHGTLSNFGAVWNFIFTHKSCGQKKNGKNLLGKKKCCGQNKLDKLERMNLLFEFCFLSVQL